MSVNGINNNIGINPNYMTGKKSVLGNNFNNQIEDINRGSKVTPSVPVYFNRSIMGQNTMERNGVKGSCSFGTVKTVEELQKEIDDRIKAAEKNGPTLRETVANAFPNAVNSLYSFVGSSVVMTFDEYVKAMEEMLRKSEYEKV